MATGAVPHFDPSLIAKSGDKTAARQRSCRTFNEAREKKALRDSVDSKPVERTPEYRRTIENFAIPRWKTLKLSEIEPRDVRELLMAMRNEGKSTSMIRKTRASLSTLFATALEDGLISSSPIRGVRIPAPLVEETPTKERAKALTRTELATLLSAKSGAGRRDIPLAPGLTTRLAVHREATYAGPTEPVFPSKVGTELIRGKVAENVLNPARDLVQMPWVSFHAFRHTCASLLLPTARTSSRSRPGSATPTQPSLCAPTSTFWKTESVAPTSSTMRSKSVVGRGRRIRRKPEAPRDCPPGANRWAGQSGSSPPQHLYFTASATGPTP